MSNTINRAAFWVLSGSRFVAEATQSAASVARHMPDLARILFVADGRPADLAPFTHVHDLPARQDDLWYVDCSRYVAYAVEQLRKYDQLLYLDADTYACRPFPELFRLLEKFDIAAAHNPGCEPTGSVYNLPHSFPEPNIGVIPFRNTGKLLNFWRDVAERHAHHRDVYGNNDQGPFRDALWDNVFGIQLVTFPHEFNCRITVGAAVSEPVRILHAHLADPEAVAELANSRVGVRMVHYAV